MADFTGELNLNSRRNPIGTIKTGDLKGGIKRSQLAPQYQAIFDAVNNKDASKGNVDDILDANEMDAFWEKLKEFAKNDKLSGREAKKFIKDLGLQDISKEDLFNFVNEIYGQSEDIESSSVAQDGTIIINYKEDQNGNKVQERILTDKTSELISNDNDGNNETTYLDANGKTKQVIQKMANGDMKTFTYTDAEGNVVLNNDGQEVIVQYEALENNGVRKSTVNYEGGKEHDATVIEGGLTSRYTYIDGNPVLMQTVVDKGNGLTAITDYVYNENNTIIATTKEGETTTVQTLLNTANGDIPLEEVITEGNKKTISQFDYENNLKLETITEGDNATTNIYQMVQADDGTVTLKKIQQCKQVNGKEYKVEYDENGNTLGVVVQNGESPAAIAKKFGCTVEELFAANPDLVHGKGNGRYFNVGETIKIPKMLEADNKALQGRKSAEVVKAEYQQYVAEQERQKALKKMGWNGKKDPMDGKTFTYAGQQYTVLGRKTNRERLLVMDKKGHVYTASHGKNGAKISILKDNYVALTDYYDFNQNKAITLNGKKYVPTPSEVKTTKDGRKYIEINGFQIPAEYGNGYKGKDGNNYRDKFGRTSVVCENGDLRALSGALEKNLNNGHRFVLDPRYLYASDMQVAAKAKGQGDKVGKSCYGCDQYRAITVGGVTYYFDKNGYAHEANLVEEQIAQNVKADLDKAANDKTLWIIPDTDETLMSAANKGIINENILNKIDKAYEADGYKAAGEYKSAYEAFLGTELNIKEVYVLDATLVKNAAITDQKRRDQILRTNVIQYGDTNENLHAGLDAVSNRADYNALVVAAGDANKAKGHKAQFKDQNDLCTWIYGVTDGEAEEISAAYNKLIDPQEDFLTKDEICQMRAEEGVYWIRQARGRGIFQGKAAQDYNQFFNNYVDNNLYHKVDDLLAEHGETSISGDEKLLQHCGTSLIKADYVSQEFRVKELVSNLRTVKNAIRQSNEATSFARNLDNCLPGQGRGFSHGAEISGSAEAYANGIAMLTSLMNNEDTYNAFMTEISKDPELKACWENLLKEGKISKQNMRFEAKQSNLTQNQIDENNEILSALRQNQDIVARESSSLVDSEGGKFDFINEARAAMGLGITREQLNAALGRLNYSMRDLELAAQGKLQNGATGQYISFDELLEEIQKQLGSVQQMGNVYQVSQQYGEAAVDLSTLILTMPMAGAGVTKVYSFVSNGVKQFKVIQVVGNVTKELGVVRSLEAAKALIPTRVASFGSKALNAERLFVSSGTSALVAAEQYGIDRLDQVTSVSGDNMLKRQYTRDKAIMTGVTTFAGMETAGLTECLDVNFAQRMARAGICVASDVTVSTGVEYSQRGEVSEEGFLMNMTTSILSNGTSIKIRKTSKPPVTPIDTTPSAPKSTPLDKATVNGTKAPGGAFKGERFSNEVIPKVKAEVPSATPERLAQIHNEGHKLQSQSRPQGREIKHIVEDGASYVEIGKKRIPLDTAPVEDLQWAKQQVEGWSTTSRDKKAILDKINHQIEARKDNPTPKPSKPTETVELINKNMQKDAKSILNGERGAIGSHDAATLSDHITNNLNTVEELEAFIGQVKRRVGTYENGDMHVYQVEGKDHAADLVKQAQTKIKTIKANQAEFKDVTAKIDAAIADNKGLSEDVFKAAQAFMKKSNSVDELTALSTKLKQVKKSGATRKLIKDIDTRIKDLEAKPAATESEKINTQAPVSDSQPKVDPSSSSQTYKNRPAEPDPQVPREIYTDSHSIFVNEQPSGIVIEPYTGNNRFAGRFSSSRVSETPSQPVASKPKAPAPKASGKIDAPEPRVSNLAEGEVKIPEHISSTILQEEIDVLLKLRNNERITIVKGNGAVEYINKNGTIEQGPLIVGGDVEGLVGQPGVYKVGSRSNTPSQPAASKPKAPAPKASGKIDAPEPRVSNLAEGGVKIPEHISSNISQEEIDVLLKLRNNESITIVKGNRAVGYINNNGTIEQRPLIVCGGVEGLVAHKGVYIVGSRSNTPS